MYKRKKPIFAKIEYTCSVFELPHDKTNKVTVRPVKTLSSLIRVSLSAWRKLGSLATHWAHKAAHLQTIMTFHLHLQVKKNNLQVGTLSFFANLWLLQVKTWNIKRYSRVLLQKYELFLEISCHFQSALQTTRRDGVKCCFFRVTCYSLSDNLN